MKQLAVIVLALAATACGGDGDGHVINSIEQTAAAAPQRMRALAVPVGADARLNAERLMDFAQERYKDLFPTAETTRTLQGWVYRFYPTTGVYLAVVNWRVYVVGGPLGGDVRDVGEVSDHITITSPTNQPPTVDLTLGLIQAAPVPTLVLTAAAADKDGTVAKVEFFNGSAKLGETRAAPHVLTLASLPAGLYELTAKATDDAGSSTTTAVTRVKLDSNTTPPPGAPITVATLAKCSTALGSSAADSYACLVGNTPTGVITGTTDQSCSMSVSDVGLLTLTVGDQKYALTVPQLTPSERNFTKTSAALSFDYGPLSPTATSIRIRGRTEDKVLGQFFQQGGNLVIEVKRAAPATDISCTVPLALS